MAVNEIRVHMIAGDGETSYTNNSAPQKIGISKALHVLDEGLKDMVINDKNGFSKCFKMADLGCSSGPNTLSVVSHIIDKIQQLSNKDQICHDEFQVFLNDLPGNDFNNLFKLLPQFYHKLDHHEQGTRSCFVSGVPGSIWFTHHTVSIGSLRFLKDWRAIEVTYTYQRRVHRRYLKLTESSFIEIYRHSSAQGAKNWYLEAVCGRCFERNRATLARREILRRL